MTERYPKAVSMPPHMPEVIILKGKVTLKSHPRDGDLENCDFLMIFWDWKNTSCSFAKEVPSSAVT